LYADTLSTNGFYTRATMPALTGFALGYLPGSSTSYYAGLLSEVVMWGAVLSAGDQAIVRGDQQTFYATV
jgi:hypothetical protein